MPALIVWLEMLYFLRMAYTPEFLDKLAEAQDVFVWEAPAWERHERSPKWYIWMSVIALLFGVYAVFTGNFLFAFIIFLLAIILILAGNEHPHRALVQIGQNGVVVDGRLYLFDQLSDFAIIYHPPETKVLYVQPKSAVRGRLRISLETQDPVAIRSHLRKYLEEDLDLRNEHFSDIVGRFLKI